MSSRSPFARVVGTSTGGAGGGGVGGYGLGNGMVPTQTPARRYFPSESFPWPLPGSAVQGGVGGAGGIGMIATPKAPWTQPYHPWGPWVVYPRGWMPWNPIYDGGKSGPYY